MSEVKLEDEVGTNPTKDEFSFLVVSIFRSFPVAESMAIGLTAAVNDSAMFDVFVV